MELAELEPESARTVQYPFCRLAYHKLFGALRAEGSRACVLIDGAVVAAAPLWI